MSDERKLERMIIDADHWDKHCRACGFALVEIRGRHPDDSRRKVCAQCLVERVEELSQTACIAQAVRMRT